MSGAGVTIEVLPSYEAVSEHAFEQVARCIENHPRATLGMATGSTPVGLYRRLAAANLDWSLVTTFNLDEYAGLAPEHPQSYHHFMEEHLFQHINIDRAHVHLPRVSEGSSVYEKKIMHAGGIDLQVLGIGGNGHIGFNEPGAAHDSRTRVVALAARTLADNARFFESPAQVPRHAITMGIGTILEARSILLMACGAGKAPAVVRALEGPVTADIPASALQQHPAVHVLLDEAAASTLSNR